MNEGLKRLEGIDPTSKAVGVVPEMEKNLISFMTEAKAAMNDDFNTAKVIARMFDALPVVNQLFKDREAAFAVNIDTFNNFREAFREVYGKWLGLQSLDEMSQSGEDDVTDGLMQVIIKLRGEARADKNWAIADFIRDQLVANKIKLEDTTDGTDWYYDR